VIGEEHFEVVGQVCYEHEPARDAGVTRRKKVGWKKVLVLVHITAQVRVGTAEQAVFRCAVTGRKHGSVDVFQCLNKRCL
jgi:hypothetical protein